MITINNFTHRLGNQMFQIAAAFQHAKKDHQNFLLPREWEYQKYFSYLHPVKTLNDHITTVWTEPSFNFTPIPKIGGSMALDGYFQSENYFSFSTALEIFRFNEIFSPFINFDTSKTCSIHVRRGDYVGLPDHHPLLPMSYYIEAMKLSPVKNFIVFSDDIEWCKKNFTLETIGHIENEKGFDDLHITFSEGRSDIEDLYLMTKCAHNIIANSSFSWWGAYLNQNKKTVISPSKDNWHGKAYADWNHNDLLPASWKQIIVKN